MKFVAVVFLAHSVSSVVVEQGRYVENDYYDDSIAKWGPEINFGPTTLTVNHTGKPFPLEKCKNSKSSSIAQSYSNESVLNNGTKVQSTAINDYYEDHEVEDDYSQANPATLALTAKGDLQVQLKASGSGADLTVSSKKFSVSATIEKTFDSASTKINRTFSFLLPVSTGAVNVFVNAGAGFEIAATGAKATISYSFDVEFSVCVSAQLGGIIPMPCSLNQSMPKFTNSKFVLNFTTKKVVGKVYAFAGFEVEYASVVSTSLKLVAEAIADNEAKCEIGLNWVFEAQALKALTHFLNFVGDGWKKATGFCVPVLDSAVFPDLFKGNITARQCSPSVGAGVGMILGFIG